MADTEEKVNKAKKLINTIIETAASIPEGQNELKRNQLRELAALNGTLRDDENQACQNCGEIGHRKYDCPQQRNFTANIICRHCGNAGHLQRECPERARGTAYERGPARPARQAGDAVDREYESLMQELSGGGASGAGPQHRIEAGPGGYDGNANGYGGASSGSAPPWRSGGSSGAAAPWARSREKDNAGGSAAAPWASGGRGAGSDSNGSYGNNSNYVAQPAAGGAAPWAQQGVQWSGAQSVDPNYAAYMQYFAAAAAAGAPGTAGTPGIASYYSAGAGPPPPPGDAPPPPPGDVPPPPPPGA